MKSNRTVTDFRRTEILLLFIIGQLAPVGLGELRGVGRWELGLALCVCLEGLEAFMFRR